MGSAEEVEEGVRDQRPVLVRRLRIREVGRVRGAIPCAKQPIEANPIRINGLPPLLRELFLGILLLVLSEQVDLIIIVLSGGRRSGRSGERFAGLARACEGRVL